MPLDLSVIITVWNVKDLALRAIRSVRASTHAIRYEILVVDDLSPDGAAEAILAEFPPVQFPEVIVLRNARNLGFAGSNNVGLRQAQGRYVLLLNADTEVQPDALDEMVRFMDEHPDAGASTCRLELPNGQLDPASVRTIPTRTSAFYQALGLHRLFPKSKRFAKYTASSFIDQSRTQKIECLVGAFALVRREVVESVGLLDEQFFMYGEDIDWCYRILQAGWSIYYHPAARVIHYKGESNKQRALRMNYEFHRAMVLFYRKHYAGKSFFLLDWFTYAGICLRCFFSYVRLLISRPLRFR